MRQVCRICKESRQLLERAKDLSRKPPASNSFADNDVSLVRDSSGDTCFVYWSNANRRRGRRVGLNTNLTLKAIFWGSVEPEDFSEAHCIVSRLPIPYSHRKASEAQVVPDWVLRLRGQSELAAFPGPLLANQPRECVVCKVLSENEMPHMTDLSEEMYGCALCLSRRHWCCARWASGHAGAAEPTAFRICSGCHDAILFYQARA